VTDQQVRAADTAADDAEDLAASSASEPDLSSIGRSAGRGLRWALMGNLVMKVGSFALSLAMVRLLAPEDFGLYAVALAANSFLIHVNDVGLIAATVQWRGRVEEMLPTARTMAIAFSLVWYGLFWLGAPILASAAHSPEATPLVRLMTLVIVIDGITAVSVGMLQRRFQQDRLMKAIAIGWVFCAATNLALAGEGAGAYSFVIGALVQSVVVAVLVLHSAGLPFRLGLDRVVARRLLVFGIPLAAGLGVESVVLFSDTIIVGHVLGTVVLGFYLLAYNVSSWVPGLVGAAVRYVSIPAFSRLAEGEDDTLALGVHRALPMLVTFVAPVAAALFTLSPALIDVLYGSHWEPAAAALQFLAFVMVARMFTALVFDIQTGLGNTKVTVGLNLVWLVALLPALWIGAHADGIRGAAMGHALVAMVVAIPLAGALLHRAGVHMGPVLRLVVRPVLAAVAAGLVMAGLAHQIDSPFWQLAFAGGAGMVVYLALAFPPDVWKTAVRWVISSMGGYQGAHL
jgi:O-antigen/teichoic acid export membrane protein